MGNMHMRDIRFVGESGKQKYLDKS